MFSHGLSKSVIFWVKYWNFWAQYRTRMKISSLKVNSLLKVTIPFLKPQPNFPFSTYCITNRNIRRGLLRSSQWRPDGEWRDDGIKVEEITILVEKKWSQCCRLNTVWVLFEYSNWCFSTYKVLKQYSNESFGFIFFQAPCHLLLSPQNDYSGC